MGDRLFSAFGQDTIDALFWTATEPKGRKREHIGVIPHFLLTIIYVILHSLLVLLQATSLNVAINASNKALLTIMMSSNVSTIFHPSLSLHSIFFLLYIYIYIHIHIYISIYSDSLLNWKAAFLRSLTRIICSKFPAPTSEKGFTYLRFCS